MDEQNVSLRVENVVKRYGDFTAVDRISFNVRAGRIFGFLGPNGAGKTTTIRMIVGITAPDEGNINFFGSRMSAALKDKIGYLPEERGLYRKMKVREQLQYFAALKGAEGKIAEQNIDFWLERLGLTEWKLKKAADLSKGMSQKIQFIAAVLHDPDLLVLDEPFSGLDPVNTEVLLEIIGELKEKGKTIIFSTHLMETAERLCDDIILINKSRKILGGTIREVKQSFGKNLIALRCRNAGELLTDKSLAARCVFRADEAEIELAENIKPQDLLKILVEKGAEISKFEVVEPSLNDIFLEKVKEQNA